MSLSKSNILGNLTLTSKSASHEHASSCLNALSNVASDYMTTTGGYTMSATSAYPFAPIGMSSECSIEDNDRSSLRSKSIRVFNETFIEEGLRTMMNSLNESIIKSKTKDTELNRKIDSIAVLSKSKILLISSTTKFGKYSIECRLLDTESEVISEPCVLMLANLEDKAQADLYKGVDPHVIDFICWESLYNAIENYKEELKKNELP